MNARVALTRRARARAWGLIAALLLAAASCTDGLPVTQAPCPCPQGYCCQQNKCIAGADCARLATGDNRALTFTPSGNWLAYLKTDGGSVAAGAPGGRLAVHAVGGEVNVDLDDVAGTRPHLFALGADAVVGDQFFWTPDRGLRSFDFNVPLAISADGRYVAAWDQASTLKVHDTVGLPAPAATFNTSLPAAVLGASAAFNPTQTALFVTLGFAGRATRILRIPKGTELEAAFDIDGASTLSFTAKSAAIISSSNRLFTWPDGAPQPTELWAVVGRENAAEPLFFAVDRNWVYFSNPPPAGGLDRVDATTGKHEVLGGDWELLSPLSPDGRYVVVGSRVARGRTVLNLEAGQPLEPFDGGCADSGFLTSRVWFSGDSRFLVAINGCPATAGSTGAFGDLVVVDLESGLHRTLIKDAVAFDASAPDSAPIQLMDTRTALLVGRGGDLFIVSLDTGAIRTLAYGVSRSVAVHGASIAFTVVGAGAGQGLYLMTLRQ